jgi:hypothetical protein
MKNHKAAGLNQLGPTHGHAFNLSDPWRYRRKSSWPMTTERHIHAMEARSHQARAKRPISLPVITIPWATE